MSDTNTKTAVFPYTARDNGRVQVETSHNTLAYKDVLLSKVRDSHNFIHGRTAVWIAIHGIVYLELSVSVESLSSKFPIPNPEPRYVRPLQAEPMKDDRFGYIFIYCNWVVTRWQWLFYMYTKYEIGYY